MGAIRCQSRGGSDLEVVEGEVEPVERKQLGWLRRTLKRLAGQDLEADLEVRLLNVQKLSAKLEESLAQKERDLTNTTFELEAAKDREAIEKELREALEEEVRSISRAANLNEARLRKDLEEEEKKAKALKSAYEELSDSFEGGQTESENELQRLRKEVAEAKRFVESAARAAEAREREFHQEKESLEKQLKQERTRADDAEREGGRVAREVKQVKKKNLRLQGELDTSQETLSTLIKKLEGWKVKNSTLLRPSANQ